MDNLRYPKKGNREISPHRPGLENLLASADLKKAELASLRPLQPLAVKSLVAAYDLELMVASNQIEGNSLTLRETQLVLEKGITIGGKPLKDHIDAINLDTAWKLAKSLVENKIPITEAVCLELHKIILTRIDDDNAGRYRRERVFILASKHIPPNPLKLPELLQKTWSEFAAAGETNLYNHPICKLAKLHHAITSIHPFVDGNGRTARLLLNLGLAQAGFPPAQILTQNKLEYYNALENVDTGKDPQAFNRYIAGAVNASLDKYLVALKN